MTAAEANFDGIVGPTHHYGGLARGNVASAINVGRVSRPREAALQGLAKMKALADLGLVQGVLPPHERPHLGLLRDLGFAGSDADVVAQAGRTDRTLLEAAYSASAMWVANAATVSPSADTADQRVHFSVANLASMVHRSIEAEETERILEATFPDRSSFSIHPPLPAAFGDEGAANHTRLAPSYGQPGIEQFTYGRPGSALPTRFPARQHRAASEAVARRHQLDASRTVFAQQHPIAIDRGVFHNDVIAVGNLELLLRHELAYADGDAIDGALQQLLPDLSIVVVPEARIDLERAVATYFFNSQLVTVDDRTVLVAPAEVREDAVVWEYVQELQTGPIDDVLVFDLRQSMRNGGGPACLRLRVVLTDDELRAVNPGSMMDASLFGRLEDWVNRHYREELAVADLADPSLIDEVRVALDELTGILGLGAIYSFQR